MGAARAFELRLLFLLAGLHGGSGDGLIDALLALGADGMHAASGSSTGSGKVIGQYLPVTYNRGMQPLVDVNVGGQPLDLVFDTSSGNTFVFVQERGACDHNARCYSYDLAANSGKGDVRICLENQDMICENGHGDGYLCRTAKQPSPQLQGDSAHNDQLVIDGLQYNLRGIEAKDVVEVQLRLSGDSLINAVALAPKPLRLLIKKFEVPIFSVPGATWTSPLHLFRGASGLLGASGVSLSCRHTSIWQSLLESQQVTSFALDFLPPEWARLAYAAETGEGLSRVVLNPASRDTIVWSEPKQIGDFRFEGMHQFVLYHPTICASRLLHGRSSNWLAIIDTSGPCLSLPPFLFDSLMKHIPVRCPFIIGEPMLGRLCTPDRNRSLASTFQTSDGPVTMNVSLPSLWFQLRDDRGTSDVARIPLPLERLVFDAEGGVGELLCVARSDGDTPEATVDMMFSHIGFGSLAVAAVYTEIDLINNRTGLQARSNATAESTNAFCSEKAVCISPMQEYDEAVNHCKDPDCRTYMFMYLDQNTKMCVWSIIAPLNLGIALAALAALDFMSHRYYRLALNRARDMCE